MCVARLFPQRGCLLCRTTNDTIFGTPDQTQARPPPFAIRSTRSLPGSGRTIWDAERQAVGAEPAAASRRGSRGRSRARSIRISGGIHPRGASPEGGQRQQRIEAGHFLRQRLPPLLLRCLGSEIVDCGHALPRSTCAFNDRWCDQG